MKRLGLIGGTSWPSTIEYYRNINTLVNAELGGMNAAILSLDSVNFGELAGNLKAKRHDANIQLFAEAGLRLKASGAEAFMICANTPHMYAPNVKALVGLPIIHIAEAVRDAVQYQGLKRVALMGTLFTMELDFYPSILGQGGIDVLLPNFEDRQMIDRSIFDELGRNIFRPETKVVYQEAIQRLVDAGAEGIIMACTEIPLLLSPDEVPVPSFDTVAIHSHAAADYILGR